MRRTTAITRIVIPVAVAGGLVATWMVVRTWRTRRLPRPLQQLWLLGLDLADELTVGRGGVPASTVDEGAFDVRARERAREVVGIGVPPDLGAARGAVDHDRAPGVPPEANEDYDLEDATLAETFPASDPPSRW